jgi:hypothetical protein
MPRLNVRDRDIGRGRYDFKNVTGGDVTDIDLTVRVLPEPGGIAEVDVSVRRIGNRKKRTRNVLKV